jgi:hypothetical protein
MMAFCPEGVEMGKFVPDRWYCRGAEDASPEYGNLARDMILGVMATTDWP